MPAPKPSTALVKITEPHFPWMVFRGLRLQDRSPPSPPELMQALLATSDPRVQRSTTRGPSVGAPVQAKVGSCQRLERRCSHASRQGLQGHPDEWTTVSSQAIQGAFSQDLQEHLALLEDRLMGEHHRSEREVPSMVVPTSPRAQACQGYLQTPRMLVDPVD